MINVFKFRKKVHLLYNTCEWRDEMKFFKAKKFKIIRNILIIIFILYAILVILRINISKGTITNINIYYNTIDVTIDGHTHWLSADDALILNKDNKIISLNTLEIGDNIFILNYNWRGWIYQPVASIIPEIYNVWFLKVID